MENLAVLLVDDDKATLDSLWRLLSSKVGKITAAENGADALHAMDRREYDLILLDINLPDSDGLKLLKSAREKNPYASVVMMTAYATVDGAVKALRRGASDFLLKPFEADQVLLLLERVVERKRLEDANREYQREMSTSFDFSGIITKNREFIEILNSLRKVARKRTGILVTGESGTGKELVARAVHINSDRADMPFIAVNCGAIPPTLIESELFGHEKGSFTGAIERHRGYFERANGSTLFLDEIGDLPLPLQVKLLRVIEEGKITRIGDTREIGLDFRLIAATNRDLGAEVDAGRFRKDLYYRLAVFHIKLPPLRERPEDVEPLVNHFLKLLSRPQLKFSKDALKAMKRYGWPGNVRELQNLLERTALLSDSEVIEEDHLPPEFETEKEDIRLSIPDDLSDYKEVIKMTTDLAATKLIRRAMEETGGNVTHAARLLGISRRFLIYRLNELGLREEQEE